jgi:hypothetical protein
VRLLVRMRLWVLVLFTVLAWTDSPIMRCRICCSNSESEMAVAKTVALAAACEERSFSLATYSLLALPTEKAPTWSWVRLLLLDVVVLSVVVVLSIAVEMVVSFSLAYSSSSLFSLFSHTKSRMNRECSRIEVCVRVWDSKSLEGVGYIVSCCCNCCCCCDSSLVCSSVVSIGHVDDANSIISSALLLEGFIGFFRLNDRDTHPIQSTTINVLLLVERRLLTMLYCCCDYTIDKTRQRAKEQKMGLFSYSEYFWRYSFESWEKNVRTITPRAL